MSYYEKYLKYKQKYLNLKNQINHIGSGGDRCIICKKDEDEIWIYKTNPTICEDCYKKQNKDVIEYHHLQDLALEDIKKGNIKDAIKKLEETIMLRNKHASTYFNDGNKGHNDFANQVLPELIKELSKENISKGEALSIWANKLSK
jgi:hypothetical protein